MVLYLSTGTPLVIVGIAVGPGIAYDQYGNENL